QQGVKFHSGNPLTVDDIVWSLHRALLVPAPASTWFKQYGFTEENIAGLIVAPDAKTVEINFPEPVDPGLALFLLAHSYTSIIDKKVALEHEKDGDLGAAWLDTNTAGSGPFTLREWQ